MRLRQAKVLLPLPAPALRELHSLLLSLFNPLLRCCFGVLGPLLSLLFLLFSSLAPGLLVLFSGRARNHSCLLEWLRPGLLLPYRGDRRRRSSLLPHYRFGLLLCGSRSSGWEHLLDRCRVIFDWCCVRYRLGLRYHRGHCLVLGILRRG